jgi:hypothetical protein
MSDIATISAPMAHGPLATRRPWRSPLTIPSARASAGIEAALDPDGYSTTARAMLRRIGVASEQR